MTLMPVAEAQARLLALAPTLPDETVDLENAAGRWLAEDVRALGKLRQRGGQTPYFAHGVGMDENRQAEGCLGDEDVAAHRFERCAGCIGMALVIA